MNQAWRKFSWDADLINALATFNTGIGTPSYQLTGTWKRLLDVVYDTAGTPASLLRSSEDYERNLSGLWRVTTGTPARWVLTDFGELHLIPVPSAVKAVSVRGIVEGSDMTTGTDQPGQVGGVGTPIPASLHEAIAIYACFLQGKIWAQDASRQRLSDLLTEYQAFVTTAVESVR